MLEQIEKQIKQKRERKQLKSTPAEEHQRIAYVEALLQEKDARIAELTEALKHERERNRKPFWLRWFNRF